VQQDIAEGTRLGVTGTPTFFVNGRLLVGAQPLAAFVSVIEGELARVR
jgi:protein-disulfide isomerase